MNIIMAAAQRTGTMQVRTAPGPDGMDCIVVGFIGRILLWVWAERRFLRTERCFVVIGFLASHS